MKCICCHSDAVVPRKPLRGYQIYRCANCSFGFVHPFPSITEIEAFYNKTRVSGDLRKIIGEYIEDFDKRRQAPKHDWFDKVLTDAKKYADNHRPGKKENFSFGCFAFLKDGRKEYGE